MEFIEITKDNWKDCAFLTDKDDKYIASNLYSIAEAQFYEKAFSKAICVKNEIIGYTMFGEDEDNSEVFFIDRFMIGKLFRRKGYGTMALQKILTIGKELGFNKFETSSVPENIAMHSLLKKNGFKTNNEIREGEIVFYYHN